MEIPVGLTLTLVVTMLLLPVGAFAQRQDVEIPARDGTMLQATYYSPSRPGPGVVLFRNCDQQRGGVDAFATKLMARGVHVLSYEYRQGVMHGKTHTETRIEDMRAVHDWFTARRAVDRTRLAGAGGSCGVQLALDFAVSYAPNVRAVLIMSGPGTDAHRDFLARADWLAVLAVAGTDDNSEQYIRPLGEATRHAHSRLMMLDKGAHGTLMLTADNRLEPLALDWLVQRLAGDAR
jgi:dienelactone hydrolase